jgi:predicted Zn-dependent peptidase
MKRLLSLAIFAFFLRPAAASENLGMDVKETKLANGLTVLVVERPVPVAALVLVMPVGAMDAPAGKTGLPHMLEHMLFKGTRTIGTRDYAKEAPLLDQLDGAELDLNVEKARPQPSLKHLKILRERIKKLQAQEHQYVVKDELDQIYGQHGGRSLNAWTSQDVTAYTVLLPSNQVPVYAALEADRYQHPVFREFYSEREVVMQERRQRVDANPEGRLFEELFHGAFQVHPYGDPAIGWMPEIARLLRPDIQDFYDRGYRPDRGVLAVVGGVKADEVFALFERTLGRVRNPTVKPLRSPQAVEPPQQKQRRVQVAFEADPMAALAWHQPSFPQADGATMDVLASVLTAGNSSRLIRNLVLDKPVLATVSASAGEPGQRDPSLFTLFFTPGSGRGLGDGLSAVDGELSRLRNFGVTQAELDRARKTVQAGYLWEKDSPESLATDLAYTQAIHGDWKLINRYLQEVEALTPADLKQAAQRYLVDSNRTVAFLNRPVKGSKP